MLGRPNWLEPVLADDLARPRADPTSGEELTASLTAQKQFQSIAPNGVPEHRHVGSPPVHSRVTTPSRFSKTRATAAQPRCSDEPTSPSSRSCWSNRSIVA